MQLGDARKLTQDAQEALRKRTIRLVNVNHKPVREVADILGVARWTVYINPSYKQMTQAA